MKKPVATFLGFGEAAQAFASALVQPRAQDTRQWRAFDRKTDFGTDRAAKLADYERHGVTGSLDLADAVAGAEIIFSLVTPDQALPAALDVARAGLEQGARFFDMNSASPGSKREAARTIVEAGGRYADVAVMAPVHPARLRVPMLLAAADMEDAEDSLTRMGFNVRAIGREAGAATSIKMIRSVMVKGLEALTAECLLAARAAGVEAEVIASLEASHPSLDLAGRSAYNLERMATHGVRRAAEMRQVGETVSELGLPAAMSDATARWQQTMAGVPLGVENVLSGSLDAVLAALRERSS